MKNKIVETYIKKGRPKGVLQHMYEIRLIIQNTLGSGNLVGEDGNIFYVSSAYDSKE